MAQAHSAQREPSMEEILSSIRRIIEDSDAGAKQAEQISGDTSGNAESESAGELTGQPENENVVHEEPSPSSLADIQLEIARDRAQAASSPAEKETPEPEPGPGTMGVKADIVEESTLAGEMAAGSAEETVSQAATEAETTEAEDNALSGSGAGEVEWAHALSEDPVQGKSNVPATATDRQAAQKPSSGPILSEEAGRRVAASFEQLSEAFMENRAKAFDSMAEEMLRPMLQEWLDENLPTLVEKLVREEIERVARGG